MSFIERKITDQEIKDYGVQAVPKDYSEGDFKEVQKIFDRLTQEVIKIKFNALIDELIKKTAPSAADQIGCAGIEGILSGDSATVRQMLIAIKNQIDNAVVSGLVENTITEGHLTADAVMKSLLTAYLIANAGIPNDLAATDTVAEAFGKIERKIKNILAGVETAGKAKDYEAGGGIETALNGKMADRGFDTEPTNESTNLINSHYLKILFDKKVNSTNGELKDTITTFTEAETQANIATGEKTSTIFGKIKKFFTDLKALAFKATVGTSDVDDNAVTNAKLAPMPPMTLKGNNAESTAKPTDISIASLKGMLESVYDRVIRTQAEFETLIASENWLGAKSVAFVGQFTLSTQNNSGIKVPSTVKQIHGFNSAKITVTNFVYNATTAPAILRYETLPSTNDYSISHLEISCNSVITKGFANFVNLICCTLNSEGWSCDGFYNCVNLVNCLSDANATGGARGFVYCSNIINCESKAFATEGGNAFAFDHCSNITNCKGKGVAVEGGGHAFYDCSYAVNCQDDGSSASMWGGTNKGIDIETCKKTPSTADTSALNV